MSATARFLAASLLLSAAIASTGCSDAEPFNPLTGPQPAQAAVGANSVRVLSRNIYLGADIAPIVTIADPNQVPFAIAGAWAAIQSTNFRERAGALAREIAQTQPHLVGIQEGTVYRIQSPSDFVLGVMQPNATTIDIDFVAVLMDSLAARGFDYRIVASVQNLDVEFPMYTGSGPIPFDDVRYNDYDVILAAADVQVFRSWANNFVARAPLSVAGLPLDWKQGWVAVEAVVDGDTIIFTNTHLEIQPFRPVSELQALELIDWLKQFDRTIVLVGDFNSAANPSAAPGDRTESYRMLMEAGYTDLWRHGRSVHDEGLTCCHDKDLRNARPNFDQRLDIVFVKPRQTAFAGAAQLQILGINQWERTASGLWPSDHAGVAATIHLPRR